MGATAADQIRKSITDFLLRWMRVAREQFGARHDPAVDAVTALIDLLRNPGGL